MTSPLQPSNPGKNDIGRLSAAAPLQPDWPCRWCHEPLFPMDVQGTVVTGTFIFCLNCDEPTGTTAKFVR